jgi:hypothetical protein
MLDKRMFAVLALGVFHSAALASAQQEQQQISSSSFTQEQTAVYQAFFADYRRGRSQEWMNVAEVTDILQPDDGDYSGCMKGFPKAPSDKVIHRLPEDFGQQNHLRIVDPRTHKVQGPEDGMRKGQSVESAVKSGFDTGLLTLSEIIFDANHKRAAFHYSFYCGGLCGHSETVVYEKRRGVWKPSKNSCGYGIS